jgi:pimeloyl-ACP methyl ester carboxylesterase
VTSILDRPAPPPDVTVTYGPLPEHVIDLRLPAQTADPAPLIVLFHGGFWRPKYDRTHLRPMANALAACGYAVAMPEYRRAGMGPDWTATFDDVAAACDQVTVLTANATGTNPSNVIWAGHSAGGHLALWAAARPYFPAGPARTAESARPDGPAGHGRIAGPVGSRWQGPCDATLVVSLAGVSSLRLCAQWNLDDGAAQNLLGGGPDDVPERYAATDPAALTPPSVPVTVVHGTADDRVPIGMSHASGIGRLIELPGADHFDLIDPHSRYWPQVLAAITA